MKRARGFTLMEAMVTLAIVSIIAIAAISLYAAVTRTFTTTRKNSTLTGRAQSAIDYLVHELRSIGGNGIPAHAAIFVEDSAGPRGSGADNLPDSADLNAGAEQRPAIPGRADRITTFTALAQTPRCPISAIAGPMGSGNGTASFSFGAQCCFTTGSVRPFVRTVMLMRDDSYRPVLLTNKSGTCVFQWQDIVPPSMRSVPSTGTMSDAFFGGQAVLVDFRTIYLDALTHELTMHLDRLPATANIDPPNPDKLNDHGDEPSVTNERLRLLDGVFDFEVSLGYDLDDTGDVAETASGTGDEWLYNRPGETPAGLSGFDARQLRLIRMEVAVGLASEGVGAGIPVLSPARSTTTFLVPKQILRVVGTRFSPRNADIALSVDEGED